MSEDLILTNYSDNEITFDLKKEYCDSDNYDEEKDTCKKPEPKIEKNYFIIEKENNIWKIKKFSNFG